MAKDFQTWSDELQKAIEGAGDAATVVSVLTVSRDDYRDTYAELQAANDAMTKMKEENDRLMATNRELFMRIGQGMRDRQEPDVEPDRSETITTKDLFKEED